MGLRYICLKHIMFQALLSHFRQTENRGVWGVKQKCNKWFLRYRKIVTNITDVAVHSAYSTYI